MILIVLSLALLLGFVFLFFFLIRTRIKKINYFKEKKMETTIVSILLSLFFYIILSISIIFYITKIPQREFDKSVWKNNIGERHKMIDDLVQSNYLIGKEKDSIVSIFGKPLKVYTEEEIMEYELIGRKWADFKIYKLKLSLENDIVTKFEFSEKN